MSNSAGSAFVEIEPELRAFGQRLLAGVRRDAERAKASIDVVPNLQAFGQRLKAQLAGHRSERINIDAEADTSGVVREVDATVRRAERRGPIRLKVEADGRGIAAAGGALFAAFSARDLTRFAFGATAIASAVQPAAAALAALAAAAIGATSALSPLVGLIPALAVGASALGQGLGVAAGALFGVGDALKAYKQSQDAAAVSTTAGANAARVAARAQRDAARQLRDALSDVNEARRSSAEAVTAASERVDEAERDLARSQEAATRAQEALTDARRDAREELEDLRLSVERSALGELRAQDRLINARRNLARARLLDATSGGRASHQLRDATLDVAEADLAVREAAEKRGDEQERLNKFTRDGIDGSERVVAAQDAVRNASDRVAESRRSVAQAEQAVAKAVEAGSRRVAAALENVERAQESVSDAAERAQESTTSATKATDKFAAAMSGLSPAAQSFVRTLLSFEAPLKRLRDVAAANLFPGLERGLNAMRPLFATFEPIVAATARTLGNLGERAGRLVASPFFQRSFTTLGMANVRILESLGGAALALAPAIAQILIAAVPLAEAMARLAETSSLAFAAFIDGQEKSGGLARFFSATEHSVRLLWNILRPLIEVMVGVGRAAKQTGEFVLGGMGRSLDELATKVNSVEGQTGLRDFFASLQPALAEMGRLVVDLAREFVNFARDGAPKLAPLIKQVREELLPALVDLANKASDTGPKIVDFLTSVTKLLTALPIGPIVDVLMRFFDVLTLVAESPIGGFLFQLLTSFTSVRLAVWALTPVLGLFGVTIGALPMIVATAALLIITHWDKVKVALVTGVQFIVDKILAAVEWAARGLATAFGWVPGIGDDLKKAAKAIEGFRDRTNAALDGIKDKTIKINFEVSRQLEERVVPGRFRRGGAGANDTFHTGMDMGPIRGRPGQEVDIRAKAGEWVVTPAQMAALQGNNDGAAAPPVTNWNVTNNITAIPAGDIATEIPRRLRAAQHLWT
jgi:hypothetical protein